MFFSPREKNVSTLGRLVLLLWLLAVIIIQASYSASLSSVLTVQPLTSRIQGIDTLTSNSDPIGVQEGSFAYNYLKDELGIAESRLHVLKTQDEYVNALQGGGVAAIVAELPYAELFLASTKCQFSIVGPKFAKSGWGFAFQRDSPLAIDLSTAILQLSENGELQRIYHKWLDRNACSNQASPTVASRVSLSSFWGLFLICGVACVLALTVFFCSVCWQYSRFKPEVDECDIEHTGTRKRSRRVTKEMVFVDKKEYEIKEKIRRKSGDSKGQHSQVSDGPSSIQNHINISA